MHKQDRVALAGAALAWMLLGTPAAAEMPSQETALSLSADDARLEWGPCPAFMPASCRIAVLHGDPAKSNSDILFRVPGDTSVPHHWHTSAERMILIAGELHVTYDGQPTQVMRRGGYAYGPAKLGHSARCAKGDPCVLFIAFEHPIDAVPTEIASE